MNTKYTLLLLLLLITNVYAHAQLVFEKGKVDIQNEEHIKEYLIQQNKELQNPGFKLRLKHYAKALQSVHFTFEIMVEEIGVYNSTIKINTDLKGNILSVKKENTNVGNIIALNITSQKNKLEKLDIQALIGNFPLKKKDYKIYIASGIPELICEAQSWSPIHDRTFLIHTEGNIFQEKDNCRYLKIDTIIQAKVFNPDPLTFLSQVYGAPYIDDNDYALAWFNPAYVQKNIQATFETTSAQFILENPWVTISDFDTPAIAPVVQATPDFFYNRNHSGFEDVNAFYHITAFHDYISSIGYDTLLDDGITVDTHGMLNADNSKFSINGGFPTLDFGAGGVDDAEDADVIIHEYSHGLSWSANGNDNFMGDRSGLDEGIGDYFATSYSRAINPFGWQRVFSWDGHNEYWGGRIANTATNYPSGANLYATGEIWNAAMSSIWTDLGQIITDKLMLEAMHFFTNNTSLPEAAVYVLQADTILFNGTHTNTICSKFFAKNILDANCKPVSTKEVEEKKSNIQIRNTIGYTLYNESMEITLPESTNTTIILYDIAGKKLNQQYFPHVTNIKYHPSIILPQGIYILTVHTNKEVKSMRICR